MPYDKQTETPVAPALQQLSDPRAPEACREDTAERPRPGRQAERLGSRESPPAAGWQRGQHAADPSGALSIGEQT